MQLKQDKEFDYSKNDIVDALKKVGIAKSDNIFIHSNIGFFGKLLGFKSKEDYYYVFKDAILEIIGSDGTLIVPTYSYSFCRNEIFDKLNTEGMCGFFSEMIRTDSQALRSDDANFSVAAIGKDAKYFTENTSIYSYGQDSFCERFINKNGKICNFNLDSASSIVHYAEKLLNVPYRFDKRFFGKSLINSQLLKREFYHFVRDLNNHDHTPCFHKFDRRASELNLVKTANLGRGQIVSISAKDTLELIRREIAKDIYFLTEKFSG